MEEFCKCNPFVGGGVPAVLFGARFGLGKGFDIGETKPQRGFDCASNQEVGGASMQSGQDEECEEVSGSGAHAGCLVEYMVKVVVKQNANKHRCRWCALHPEVSPSTCWDRTAEPNRGHFLNGVPGYGICICSNGEQGESERT